MTSSDVPGARDYSFERHIARDVYLGCVRKLYPDLPIANLTDFEVMALSSGSYNGPMAGIRQWLEHEFDLVVQLHGGHCEKAILDVATEACNERVAAIGVSSAYPKAY